MFDNGSRKPIDRKICSILKFITGIYNVYYISIYQINIIFIHLSVPRHFKILYHIIYIQRLLDINIRLQSLLLRLYIFWHTCFVNIDYTYGCFFIILLVIHFALNYTFPVQIIIIIFFVLIFDEIFRNRKNARATRYSPGLRVWSQLANVLTTWLVCRTTAQDWSVGV